MKRHAAILLVLLASVACGPPPTPSADPTRNLSAAGHAAYDAKKVVTALDAVEAVAVEGEKQNPQVISSASALKVIAYYKQTVLLIDAAPSGWKVTALRGLDQLQTDLTPAEWKEIEPFVVALKAVIAVFAGGA